MLYCFHHRLMLLQRLRRLPLLRQQLPQSCRRLYRLLLRRLRPYLRPYLRLHLHLSARLLLRPLPPGLALRPLRE
jgi:hypothetical protein